MIDFKPRLIFSRRTTNHRYVWHYHNPQNDCIEISTSVRRFWEGEGNYDLAYDNLTLVAGWRCWAQ